MDDTESNKVRQEEEIEVISSIYTNEFSIIEPDNQVYLVRVPNEGANEEERSINIQFRFPPGYPAKDPLEYEIQAPWLRGAAFDRLNQELWELVTTSVDSPVVHTVVETVRTFLRRYEAEQSCCSDIASSYFTEQIEVQPQIPSAHTVPSVQYHLKAFPSLLPVAEDSPSVEIIRGETLVDRKSVFQAHCCRVHYVGQVSRFITALLEDRKIAAATHNILAWRIVDKRRGKSPVIHADCDDDGETHAGSRLLHLLTISGAENVAIVVSRWYGGIQLGPDRFKHINNVARQLLTEQGFLGSQSQPTESKGHKQKKKKH
ncbi:putative Impactlike protein [Fasciolopsis buskii]|uniref:Putative Impactlike protein n=1 Tax=Fasciolopsis buskii TaxID=27845 RepID=A0A8E0VGS4_9TREM|nr:putative Impactlike protein [Fasciolopsis buski]